MRFARDALVNGEAVQQSVDDVVAAKEEAPAAVVQKAEQAPDGAEPASALVKEEKISRGLVSSRVLGVYARAVGRRRIGAVVAAYLAAGAVMACSDVVLARWTTSASRGRAQTLMFIYGGSSLVYFRRAGESADAGSRRRRGDDADIETGAPQVPVRPQLRVYFQPAVVRAGVVGPAPGPHLHGPRGAAQLVRERAVGFAAESRLNSLGLPRRAARRSDPHALLRRDDRRRHASLQPVRGLSLAGHVAFDARRGDRRHRSSSLADQLLGALRPRVQPHDHQHRAFAARIFRSRVAAAATRIFPKDETRRRRGRDVDISRKRDAAAPRLRKLGLDRARLRRTAT